MSDPEKSALESADLEEHERGMSAWPNIEDDEIERSIIETESQHIKTDEHSGKPTAGTSGLSRIASRRSAASSWIDPGPPPDGGIQAWTQVLAAHLTIFTTFGYTTAFGVFQTHYKTELGVSPSTISWIGSVQLFMLFGIGTFSGRATDAGYFRHCYIAGAVFQLLGVFCTAQAKNFWQVFLAQAVCTGIANGLQFCPAMAVVTSYFTKKRAFACGITALGSCTGGVVYSVIVQQALPRIGFAWTLRCMGFIDLLLNLITICLFKVRVPPRKAGAIVDWASFRDLPYTLYCLSMFFTFWGLYFAFFYVGSYGRDVLGVSYQQSINLLLTIVCVGFVFRLLPTYFADKLGSINVMIPFVLLCGVMMLAWIGVHSVGALFAFAAIYGSGSAVIQALWPAIIGNLSKVHDLKKNGVRMGMAFTIVSIASLTGPPLAGALIQQNAGDYLYANIWAALSFFVGAALLIATRFTLVGWDWRTRV